MYIYSFDRILVELLHMGCLFLGLTKNTALYLELPHELGMLRASPIVHTIERREHPTRYVSSLRHRDDLDCHSRHSNVADLLRMGTSFQLGAGTICHSRCSARTISYASIDFAELLGSKGVRMRSIPIYGGNGFRSEEFMCDFVEQLHIFDIWLSEDERVRLYSDFKI